jgi:hypothetical protein
VKLAVGRVPLTPDAATVIPMIVLPAVADLEQGKLLGTPSTAAPLSSTTVAMMTIRSTMDVLCSRRCAITALHEFFASSHAALARRNSWDDRMIDRKFDNLVPIK